MQIAIISDIHDHLAKLKSALAQMKRADVLICCGDLCSSFIVRELGENFRGPIHIMFGNNDGDRYRLARVANEYSQITLYDTFANLTLDKKRIAVHHFPDIAELCVASGRFDLVCYGHNHKHYIGRKDNVLMINPGEIMGEFFGVSTFVIYDTVIDEAFRYEV